MINNARTRDAFAGTQYSNRHFGYTLSFLRNFHICNSMCYCFRPNGKNTSTFAIWSALYGSDSCHSFLYYTHTTHLQRYIHIYPDAKCEQRKLMLWKSIHTFSISTMVWFFFVCLFVASRGIEVNIIIKFNCTTHDRE